MSALHTPKVLDIIRTAAADCQAQGNTMAQNELLEAAATTSDLLAVLRRAEFALSFASPRGVQGIHDEFPKVIAAVRAVIAKATGEPA